MTRVPATKCRDDFAETLNRVAYRGERVVLERRGKAVAAIIPIEDLEALEKLEDEHDLRLARERLAQADREGTIPLQQVKRELGIK